MDSDDLGFLDIDQIFADQILSDDFLTEYSGGGSPSSGKFAKNWCELGVLKQTAQNIESII